MRFLLVYPNLMGLEYVPLGLAHLSACLKKEGHQTKLVDGTWGEATPAKIFRTIEDFGPDIIGFTALSGEFPFVVKLASFIKTRYNIPCLLGGVHATVASEVCIEARPIDMIALGECDLAVVEFAKRFERKDDWWNTGNFWVKKGDEIIRNQVRPLIDNLDRLPFPDRDLFDFDRYVHARGGTVDVMASRGCPYGCSYCINARLKDMYRSKGQLVRFRSVSNVLEEIELLVRRCDVKRIAFEDDTFTLDKTWLKHFADGMSDSGLDLPYSCNARPETITAEVVRDLARSGCEWVHIGIESGDEEIRRKVLGRSPSNATIRQAFRLAKEVGLSTYSYNMVGLPLETRESIWKTIKLNREVEPDAIQVSIFQPYPGTPIRDFCEEKQLLSPDTEVPFHQLDSVLKLSFLSRREIRKFKHRFRFYVFASGKPVRAMLAWLEDYIYSFYMSLRRALPVSVRGLVSRTRRLIFMRSGS